MQVLVRKVIDQFAAHAAAVFCMGAVLLTACGGGGSDKGSGEPAPPSQSTTIQVSPQGSKEFWGYSLSLDATALSASGASITPEPTYSWASSNAGVASVDGPSATVNLLRPGNATITASSGNATGSTSVTVMGFERLARSTGTTMCALPDGRQRIYCWGWVGTTEHPMFSGSPKEFKYEAPAVVAQGAIPSGARIRKVAVDSFHMCALTDEGAVFCWGENDHGALGLGSADAGRNAPALIARGAIPAGVRIVDIAVTYQGGCAVGDDGNLYCWGSNSHIPDPALESNDFSAAPVATVAGDRPRGVRFVKVSIDVNNGCALGDNARAYCWTIGQRIPQQVATGAVPANVRLVDLQMGSELPCALGDNGQIYCWGTAFGRRFGTGVADFISDTTPVAVADGAKPAGMRWTAFTVGGIATANCAVAENGNAYCWGNGYLGSLGDGVEATHEGLTPTPLLAGERDAAFTWVAVNCASLTCTGLASDRRIYSWGANEDLMLSRSNQISSSATPLMVTRPTRP
jgi:Regulator of chromosome condensation (RCC1) repeat